MGEETTTLAVPAVPLEERMARAAAMSPAEFRQANIAELRGLLEIAKEEWRKRLEKVPAGTLGVHVAILLDKLEQLESGPKAPAHIGQQINIQINGSSDRDALIRQLVGSVSRGTGSPNGTQHVLADCQTPDNQSVVPPGNGADATPFATPGKRRRGRPKGSRNKPKVVDAQLVDDQRPTPGGGGRARPSA